VPAGQPGEQVAPVLPTNIKLVIPVSGRIQPSLLCHFRNTKLKQTSMSISCFL